MSDSVAPASPLPGIGMPLRLAGDERLAALVHKGSERAFAALYQRHQAALYRYCATIVRHEQDAQDVLQTTMVRALSALARGVPDAPIRPWLFRIAHNEAITLLRHRRSTDDIDDARTLCAPPLEASMEQRERLAMLVADLQELPERQRGALVMRELSGLSHEEIATSLDISVGAAKQAIFDARTGLAEFQKGRVMDCAEIQRLISDGDGRMLRGRPVRAHLRSCRPCSELRDAIGMRSADLALLAPPLPMLAASGLLAKILGAGGGHGGVGGAGGMSVAAAGKTGTAVFAGKALATVAVVATVGVGAGQTLSAAPADRTQAPAKLLRGAPGSPRAALDSAAATAASTGSTRGASAAAGADGHATKASTAKTPAGSSSSSTASAPSTTPAANASSTANAHGKATSAAASARRAERRAARRPATHAAGARRGSPPASAGTQSTGAAAGQAPVSTGAPASAPAAAVPAQSTVRPTVPVTPPTPLAPPPPAKPAPAAVAPAAP